MDYNESNRIVCEVHLILSCKNNNGIVSLEKKSHKNTKLADERAFSHRLLLLLLLLYATFLLFLSYYFDRKERLLSPVE